MHDLIHVEIRVAPDLFAFLRHVGKETQGLVRRLGARARDFLHFRRRRAQWQEMHAAELLEALQELSFLGQQATNRDLLESGDAHVAPWAACFFFAILERITAEVSCSDK